MKIEDLKKAHEAVEMLKNLSLPISDAQQQVIAVLEKEYLREKIVPTVKSAATPLVEKIRFPFKIRIKFQSDNGFTFNFVGNENERRQDTVQKTRNKYTINGGEPLNKRRFVLAVVRQYADSHPGITLDELEKRFPSSLSDSQMYGVVRPYDKIKKRIENQPDLRKRFFLADEELILLQDGTKVAVFNQWKENFEKFLAVAKDLYTVEIY